MKTLKVIGARVHNLKNLTVEMPREKLVVITGLSGSGKSSLAFDTIFAEGQRRYVESLSAYARQFLGRMEKPDVDAIEGLSPAVSIDQKGASHNPRSTVGTVTEIYDYLRLLFARAGVPHCPICGREVTRQSAQEIVDAIRRLPEGSRILLLAPVVRGRKGTHQAVLEEIRKAGFTRARVDGVVYDLETDDIALDRYKQHTIEAVVDRLVVRAYTDPQEEADFLARLTDSVETALKFGDGYLVVHRLPSREGGDEGEDLPFSEHLACPEHGVSVPELEPRLFSFNTPYGACPVCQGLGFKQEIDPDLLIPDPSLSLAEGALAASEWTPHAARGGYYWQMLVSVARAYGIDLHKPVRDLPKEHLDIILYGTRGKKVAVEYRGRRSHARWRTAFEGVIPNLERRYRETTSEAMRARIEGWMSKKPCPACRGARLRPEALAVTVAGVNIVEVTSWPVSKTLEWVRNLTPPPAPLPSLAKGGEREDLPQAGRGKGEINPPPATDLTPPPPRGKAARHPLPSLDKSGEGDGGRGEINLLQIAHERGLVTTGFHLPYNPKLIARARELRAHMTPAEQKLWAFLHHQPYRVLRQRPIDHYIVDFYIPKAKLVIEVDGEQHYTEEGKAYDAERDAILAGYGLRVLRIPNAEVMSHFDQVKARIEAQVASSYHQSENITPPPPPLPSLTKGGEGEDLPQAGRGRGEINPVANEPNLTPPPPRGGGANGLSPLLTPRQYAIARRILRELEARLGFLVDVGLDYLTLDRAANTLSGGEAQRIRLATQIGSRLTGVLYVLDEPSIGLHPRDTDRLLRTLKGLRDLGNTVLVVEHDPETIRAADWIVDLGPGAGEHGGRVVAQGSVEDILASPDSLTGAYLSGRLQVPLPEKRREGTGEFLTIVGARENNLKNITVRIPLGKLVLVTGVSGSGKSSLVVETLYKALARHLNKARTQPGKHDRIEGLEHLDKVINIDQSPLGRTPRSNPGTYTGLFDHIRQRFAQLPESKIRGYKPGRFSFNVKGGRCEACQGQGQLRIEMQFLPDVFVPCEVCHGARFNRETLQVRFKGYNIADVLDMTVEQAMEVFAAFPAMMRKLQTLADVGLGYIRIGQPAPTLSGGEAQRVKLARELSKRATGHTLYVLDEPTVGLHAADVHKLIEVLHRLVDAGNTVVVIEHNLDLIKVADWIIDLGPEGGDRGGEIVAEGTPEQICQVEASYTGRYLRAYVRENH